jgi:beta-lactamase class A
LLQTRYDSAAITGFITGLRDATYIAAQPAVVSSLDGEVTSRSVGKNGQVISVEEGTKLFVDMLKKQGVSVEIPLQTIAATTQFSRSYTSTSRGLQILLQDWQSDTGVAAGVVIRESGGKGRTASINGNQSFLLASVSKLYLVHYLYDGMAAGSIKGNATYGTPSTVSTCIERMIVVSDNACFNNLGNAIGWGKISSHTASQGFTATNPNPAVYSTTAFDTADYMHMLQNGSLVTNTQRAQLLGYMQRQIYRGGIPLGSSGSVADKVGYFGAYRHDAAIVYHPKATYVLVVLTNGGSNPQISDLARRISNFMDK